MNAKLIRTEKTDWGATLYYFECSKCGNEYYRWSYNKRTTCYCSDCYNKRQREQAKAWQKRKLQEYADKVLKDIKAEIKDLCNEPARYIPNYDAYKKCWEIIDKHIGGKE